MRRKDTWLYNLKLTSAGVTVDVGVARGADGMDIESEKTMLRPGGMAPEVSLGGASSRNASKMMFAYTDTIHANIAWIENAAGKAVAIISAQPLDADGLPVGAQRTLTGTLQDVKPPEYDADSNDPAELELGIALNETAT